MIPTENSYVSTREAADLLGISLRSAQLWVENGVLTAWKTPGGHRRILMSSVQQVLAERNKLPKATPSNARLRLVLVEDDEDLRRLLQLTLEGLHAGIEIFCARDGFEGLMLIGKVHPDVLITDLNMPGMDGFRMIRAIGTGESAPRKVIVITALSPQDIADKGGVAPTIEVLHKPLALDQLERIVQDCLLQQSHDDLVDTPAQLPPQP